MSIRWPATSSLRSNLPPGVIPHSKPHGASAPWGFLFPSAACHATPLARRPTALTILPRRLRHTAFFVFIAVCCILLLSPLHEWRMSRIYLQNHGQTMTMSMIMIVCGGGKGTITPLRERPTGGAVAMQHVLLLHKKCRCNSIAVPAFPFEKQDNRWNFVHLCQSD